MLEVFNTLLKHLRLSVESEASDLQEGSAGSAGLNTGSKDNEEKIVQNAIIQTIGECISPLQAVVCGTVAEIALTEGTCLCSASADGEHQLRL